MNRPGFGENILSDAARTLAILAASCYLLGNAGRFGRWAEKRVLASIEIREIVLDKTAGAE